MPMTECTENDKFYTEIVECIKENGGLDEVTEDGIKVHYANSDDQSMDEYIIRSRIKDNQSMNEYINSLIRNNKNDELIKVELGVADHNPAGGGVTFRYSVIMQIGDDDVDSDDSDDVDSDDVDSDDVDSDDVDSDDVDSDDVDSDDEECTHSSEQSDNDSDITDSMNEENH
ncbi:hypothetical protein H4219_004460 [Mycoemilia scoparia]|uniref:Uncharacterized protein n=1 Tax=Mycoemilia scoparia TaxID=417184 RepID=A0A9W7ZSA3_9FUNG|nr:hypothetical protein H4219_004460 [Mycoemilia scoparia]